MFRFVLLLASLAALQSVYCQTGPGWPIPECTSVKCSKNTDDKLDDLIAEIAKSCQCKTCGCKDGKVCFDLHSFCEGYRNYDPETYGIIQCILNKLSNPCYEKYHDKFCQIVNKGCGCSCQSLNFNIYSFFYDVCYGCNGCLDDCYVQCGPNIIWAEPLSRTGPRITSLAGTGPPPTTPPPPGARAPIAMP